MRRRGQLIATISILAAAAVAAVPLLGSPEEQKAAKASALPQPLEDATPAHTARAPRTPLPSMHAVADSDWIEGEHAEAFDEDAASCQACHGDRLEGSVRSRAVRRRVVTLSGEDQPRAVFEYGERVSCGACHDTPELPTENGG
ncbi:MAG: hypothetical protein QNJ98_18250 [Planctomycetota bacterium]|nr:hypothetical protein [Planctomycetota bacterium]